MDENKELIIPFDKQALKMGALSLGFATLLIYCILLLSGYLSILIGAYFTRVIQIALWMIVACCGIVIVYLLYFLWFNNDRPAAILNREGVWVNRFGFIPWQDVQACQLYKLPGAPVHVVNIEVKNLKKLSKQANFEGKIAVFWSKLFNYPYILLSSTSVDNQEIISYADKHIMYED